MKPFEKNFESPVEELPENNLDHQDWDDVPLSEDALWFQAVIIWEP
jgi:hypothetical protein